MVADKTIVEGSGIRFDMLGMLGNDLYKKEIDALNTIFDKYILVLTISLWTSREEKIQD